MVRHTIRTFLLGAAGLACAGCGARDLTPGEVARGFSMQPPPGWVTGDTARANATHYWYDDFAEDGLASDIAVRQFGFRGDTGSEHVSRAIASLLANKLRDYRKVDHGPVTIAGQSATWILSEYETDPCAVEMLHYYVPFGSTMLEVCCSCVAGEMPTQRPLFEAAAATIRVE